jgi:membrane protein
MPAARRVRVLIDSLLVVMTVIGLSLGMLYQTFATSLESALAGTLEVSRQAIGGPAIRLLGVAVELAVVLVLFRYLPERRVRWRDVLPGAVLSIALFHANQWIFRSYVTHFGGRYVEVYGPLSSLTILLIWAYLTALIVLFGAEFCAAWALASARGARGGDAPLGERLDEANR